MSRNRFWRLAVVAASVWSAAGASEAASPVGTTTAVEAFSSASRFYTHQASGHYWVAFHDGTNGPVIYSSPDGVSWSSQGLIFTTFNPSSAGQWATRFTGNSVIVFGTDPSGPTRRKYRNAILNTDGTVTWFAAESPAASGSVTQLELNSLIANNKPILWYVDSTSPGNEAIGSQLNGPTWSSAPSVPPSPAGASAGGFSAGAIFPTGGVDPQDYIVLRATTAFSPTAGAHRLLAVRHDASVQAYVSSLDWFNVSMIGLAPGPYTFTESAVTEVKEGTDAEAHMRFAAVRDSSGNIHAVYVNGLDDVVHYKKGVGFNDNWSRLSTDVTPSAASIDRVALAAAPNDSLFLFYSKSDAGIYYKRFDGISWGPESTIKSASGTPLQGALAPMEYAGGCTLGIAWTEGTGPFYSVMFSSVLFGSCETFSTTAGAGTITVETPDVKMVWDAGPNGGGGLAEFYAKGEANPTVNRSGELTRYNLFSTQLNDGSEWRFEGFDQFSGARTGALEVLESTAVRVRLRQKYDYTATIHLERDWTAYAYPRLAIDETLKLDVPQDIRGAQGIHAKAPAPNCPGDGIFYCAGISDEGDGIWVTTDDGAYSDMLAMPYDSPFFGRATMSYLWEDQLEPGAPNTYFARVWESAPPISTPEGEHTRFYLFYPHLGGLTTAGGWQPFANDYRTPDTLSVAAGLGSGWFDDSENTATPADFFNEAENAYLLDLHPARGLTFDIDGLSTPRKKPFFKIRQWRSLRPPATLTLEGTTLVREVNYLAEVKPVSAAYFCPTSGCVSPSPTQLARGGLVGDTNEYLADAAVAKNSLLNFDSTSAYLYLGSDSKFRGLNVVLADKGVGTANLQWEYWNGSASAWASLEAVGGFTDQTNSLKENGTIYWTMDPIGWASSTVSGVPGSPSLYYVRAHVAFGGYTTKPIESRIATDILLFQYLSDITLDAQTFTLGPAGLTTHYRSIGTAAYATGMANTTYGSTLVTGPGAPAWKDEKRGRGDRITIPCPDPPFCSGGVHYTVFEVISNTQLTLTTAFKDGSGSYSYMIARQFTTLAAWEDCVDGGPCPFFPVASNSLVADDRREVGIAYKDTAFDLPDRVEISGSATDAAHDITLTADHGNRHHGLPGTGVILNLPSGTSAFSVVDDYVTLEWLEIRDLAAIGSGGVQLMTPVSANNKMVVRNNLIHDLPGGPAIEFLAARTVDIVNNVVYGANRGMDLGGFASTVNIDNNTIYNSIGDGVVASAGSVTLRNNISHTCGGACFNVPARTGGSSNNLSSDTTAAGPPVNHSPAGGGINSVPPGIGPGTIDFASAGAGDLHINGDSMARNQAFDLGGIFVGDIDAQRRPTGPNTWDIGADETGAPTGVDLAVAKSDGATTAVPGAPLSYVITVTNNGADTVTRLTVTDTAVSDAAPPALLSPDFTPSAGIYYPATGLWTGPGLDLRPGQSATLTLSGTVSPWARGTLRNTATVANGSGGLDPDASNDSDMDSDSLTPQADLVLAKTDSAGPVDVDGTFSYTLTVSNPNGPSDANNVVVKDTLPVEVEVDDPLSLPSECTYDLPTRLLTCTFPTVAKGGSELVTITVRAVSPGTVKNTARITASDVTDPVPSNDTDDEETVVNLPSTAVRFFTVTSTYEQNVLEWLNPPGYDRVVISFNEGPTGCEFPAGSGDGTLLVDQFDPDGNGDKDTYLHSGRTNGTVYCYGIFVDKGAGGPYSAGRFVKGRPFNNTVGLVEWAFSTGATALAPPGMGTDRVHAVSNDNAVYAIDKGTGEWPTGSPEWTPAGVALPSESRPTTVATPVDTASSVIFVSSRQDRHVYAIDAATGDSSLWSAPEDLLYTVVAAPAGMFRVYGGNRDNIMVGNFNTGQVGVGSTFFGLRVDTGAKEWGIDGTNSGSYGKIGAIPNQAVIDYPTRRAYFTSYAYDPDGPTDNNTVWCVDLTDTPPSVIWAAAHGNITTSPTLHGGRLYVGTADGRVLALNTVNGAMDWQVDTLDGPVKHFVMADRANGVIYFSTTNQVWRVPYAGPPETWVTPKTGGGSIASPSTPILYAGKLYVGSGDGKLHVLDPSDGSDDVQIQLGDGLATVGSLTIDTRQLRIYVGSEAGVIYKVQFP